MSSCPSLALLFLIEFVPNNLKTSSHMYLEKKFPESCSFAYFIFLPQGKSLSKQNKAGEGILGSWNVSIKQPLFLLFSWWFFFFLVVVFLG